MALTPAQNAAIRADILASPDLNSIPNSEDGAFAVAALYNMVASPAFVVWKYDLHEQDITSLTSPEGTVWSWTAFINRSVSEQNGWARMFNGTYRINPSLVQVRNAINDIFSGGTGAGQRAHILAIAKENSSRIEKLLANETVGTTATPATRTFVGRVTDRQIFTARNPQ